MTSRFLPYATTPGRLLGQLFSDAVIVVWTAIWALVGTAVYDAISTIAEAGRQVESGTHGIAGDLDTVLGTDARARVLAEEICQRVGA